MLVRGYQDEAADAWDKHCAAAPSATFLHTRRFLSYHGDRFVDRSVMVSRDGVMDAVFPAAEDPADQRVIVSHPGATFGGLVSSARLRGEGVLRAIEAVASHYSAAGYRQLRYKAVPHLYHRQPAQDDLYALFRLGARRYRCDLSVAVPTRRRGEVGSRRKRGHKAALKSGLRVEQGHAYFAKFWKVLTEVLRARHGALPVHTLEEMTLLSQLFPSEIDLLVACEGEEVVAGIVVFESPTVSHAQYIASNVRGNELHALDLLFEAAISRAHGAHRDYFDFGISNEDGGQVLNNGLFQFKAEFGGGGAVHEFYELRL